MVKEIRFPKGTLSLEKLIRLIYVDTSSEISCLENAKIINFLRRHADCIKNIADSAVAKKKDNTFCIHLLKPKNLTSGDLSILKNYCN